jgi:hypothetical protein
MISLRHAKGCSRCKADTYPHCEFERPVTCRSRIADCAAAEGSSDVGRHGAVVRFRADDEDSEGSVCGE